MGGGLSEEGYGYWMPYTNKRLKKMDKKDLSREARNGMSMLSRMAGLSYTRKEVAEVRMAGYVRRAIRYGADIDYVLESACRLDLPYFAFYAILKGATRPVALLKEDYHHHRADTPLIREVNRVLEVKKKGTLWPKLKSCISMRIACGILRMLKREDLY